MDFNFSILFKSIQLSTIFMTKKLEARSHTEILGVSSNSKLFIKVTFTFPITGFTFVSNILMNWQIHLRLFGYWTHKNFWILIRFKTISLYRIIYQRLCVQDETGVKNRPNDTYTKWDKFGISSFFGEYTKWE